MANSARCCAPYPVCSAVKGLRRSRRVTWVGAPVSDIVTSGALGEAVLKSSQSPRTPCAIFDLYPLPGSGIAGLWEALRDEANTWEPHVSFDCGKPSPPPRRNAQTFAMGRRIESDVTLYGAALRFMNATPAPGLDATCDLA